jgi:uncharacterized protein
MDSRPDELSTQESSAETITSPGEALVSSDVPPPRPLRPGIGFFEAIFWMVGLQIAQVVSGLLATLALAAWYIANGGEVKSLTALVELGRGHLPEILVGAQIGSVGFATLAIFWRGPRVALAGVGWSCPPLGHLVALAIVAVPLSLLCSAVQAWAFRWSPESHTDMRELFESLRGASPWGLLFAVAIAPALAEEFVFRGLIGRGLIERRGVFVGVLVTSILFAAAHLNVAQVLGVLPMGFALHFVYLTTRTLWAPVLLHFLNNGLAVAVITLFPQAIDQTGPGTEPGGELLLVSAALVMGVALFLWETRRSPAETEFRGLLSPEEAALAADLAACERRNEPTELAWVTVGLVLNGLGFLTVLSRAW